MLDTDPVIVQAYRTPQGKYNGVFADVRSEDLSIPLINQILDETGLAGEQVDDLMWGCVRQVKEQGNNLARIIALLSNLGESVPATSVDRMCASSAQTLMMASDAVRAGQRRCLIAGGVESMTRVQRDVNVCDIPGMQDNYTVEHLEMGMTAETVAERYGITREEQDAYGARSQQRAVEATEAGYFHDEIVPIKTDGGTVTEDEGLRPDTTEEKLAEIPPAFKNGGTVHAGNASQISDGAAALMITSRAFADDYGLDIAAEIGNNNVAGVPPEVMGIGPIPACKGLFKRSDATVADYDLVELNEAFASQTLYCQRELGISDERFNVNGGAIALGHPLGASGARLPVTLIHAMRRSGAERGLSTQCVGYGQGAAIEFIRP
ncbi:thiolase family protein [Halegenticoccus tardaugens]|uniref:thiolase family protein n=1 Tax=Halegenticoccus tardaugens TaxID=2071624 RepID=UPI00100B3E30|nr:thiolase family protein [Halegenticoccus tardaugens]